MSRLILAAGFGLSLGVMTALQFAAPVLAQSSSERSSVYEQLDLFGDIFERIRSQYVEEVDEAELIEAAINGMLTSLDPHSSYMSPKAAADMRVQTRVNLAGLASKLPNKMGL